MRHAARTRRVVLDADVALFSRLRLGRHERGLTDQADRERESDPAHLYLRDNVFSTGAHERLEQGNRMNRRAAALALVCAGVSFSCASSQAPERAEAPEQPAAPIRAFDIETIEDLARQMHAQDQLAWLATDVLFDHRTEKAATADGVKGWITGLRDGQETVRFIRIGDHGPEALYDVVFDGAGEPTFSTPTDRTLTRDELAQYDARILALDNIAKSCSDRYNTVALRDPESDGWLVWALAATLDPNLILIGGHYRFTISADGKAIRARDALSTSCLVFDKNEKDSAASIMSHVVSPRPVETHAFASLTYRKVFHVGTEDGSTWRIDAGRILRVEQDAPDVDGLAARALAGIEERCELIASFPGDASQRYRPAGSTKVIEATERAGPFSVEDPPGTHVEMIV